MLFCEKHRDCESRKNHKWTNCSTPVCFKINAEATETQRPLVSTEAPCSQSEIAKCPVCKRGDIWQEAVSRTEYVYGEHEVLQYLLAEVQSLLAM